MIILMITLNICSDFANENPGTDLKTYFPRWFNDKVKTLHKPNYEVFWFIF